MTLSEGFLSMVVSSVCALILVAIRLCYKSKCSDVEFCCVKFKRDVQGEEKLDYETIHRTNSDPKL